MEPTGESDIEHVAIGNRAARRQRSQGSWREHGAVRVIRVRAGLVLNCEGSSERDAAVIASGYSVAIGRDLACCSQSDLA